MVDPSVAIELAKVSFRYHPEKPQVLKQVSVKVPAGKYVTVIGHNGSGKSTLSKLIMGIFNLQEGEIRIFGTKLTGKNLDELRRFLGIVFQNPDNQFVGSTVEDDIAFGLENRQIPHDQMQAIVEKCARKVNMQDHLQTEPLMLSGGQKQQVAIASVLALSPKIIIFDEATSMLDVKGEKMIRRLMHDLKVSEHKTIISITHNVEEALDSDYVIVLNDGQVVMSGDPHTVLKDHHRLSSIGLEVPLTLKIALALQNEGVAVEPTLNEDRLISNILKLKK